MKQEWEIKKLGEVCTFLNRGISPKYVDTKGVCVLNQKCIRDHFVSYEQSRRHDSLIKPVGPERFIKVGDVLVNSTGTGTLGRVAQVRNSPKEPTTVDSHVTIVRPKAGMFYPDFFGYMLILIEEAIKEAGEGCGGQTELARSALAEKFFVNFPRSLPDQQRIVSILDEAFVSIAKAKANAEQNLKNSKELFKSYLHSVFAHKGVGWVEKALGDVCKIERGSSPRPIDKYFTDKPDGVNWIKIGDTKEVDKYIYKTRQKITKEGALQSRFVDNGDFILSNSMSFGKPYIMKTQGYIHDGWFVLRLPKNIDTEFFWYLLASPYAMNQFISLAAGAIVKNISGDLVKKTVLPIPPLKEQKTIVQRLDALSAETNKLEAIYQQKLNDLEELKKSVLQKAFNGDLKTTL